MAPCQRCDEFDIQSLITPGSTLRFDSVDVKAASDAGCDFCSLLYDRVQNVLDDIRAWKAWRGPLYIQLSTDEPRSTPKKRARDSHTVQIDRLYVSVVPHVYSHSQFVDENEYKWPISPRGDVLGVITDPGTPCSYCAVLVGSPAAKSGDIRGRLPQLTKDTDRAEVISEWLANCLQHPKCRETVSGTQFNVYNQPLPTRCVHIEPDDSGNKLFRLCETGGQSGTYVTLSHRWNVHTELAWTTTRNYNRRLDGDFGVLPDIFLEAMEIALGQGIQYIWIDSLCIIQHSVFTIMCAVSTPSEGMFRPQPLMNLTRLPYRDKQGCRNGHLFMFHRHKTPYYYMQVADVFNRGWVFQEWMLSGRLVNFTDVGIFFSCQSRQPLYEDLTEIMVTSSQDSFQHLKPFFNNQTPAGELWYRLITRYSGLLLTKKEDRLIAIAGIAAEYRRILVAQEKTDLRYTSATADVDWFHPKLPFTYRTKKCTIQPLEETDSSRHQLRLVIKGKLLPVVVRQEIPWEGDTARAIRPMTGSVFLSNPESREAPPFRAVCSVRKPELIAGWGSFDGEGIQARLGSSAGICVFALLVQARYQFSSSDTGLGRVMPILSVYDVLFLDPVADSEEKYCRVGAGCLFEPGLCREFSPVAAADIELA
ncbi:HET-domain-containing protein [Xylaria arbuscula]|nr:HET-domain-containing protein [Xylaria arbuscula]